MDDILINKFKKLLNLNRNVCFQKILKTQDGILIENTNQHISNIVPIKEICDIEEKLTPYQNLITIKSNFDFILIMIK